uniref:LPXTG cell wall anchor domain-containing protein n=1 Tax=Listeria costaricensis TaxID=2026604 RepID=UPI0013C3E976
PDTDGDGVSDGKDSAPLDPHNYSDGTSSDANDSTLEIKDATGKAKDSALPKTGDASSNTTGGWLGALLMILSFSWLRKNKAKNPKNN